MLSKVKAELDEALKKGQTSTAAEMTAKEELKEQALLAKEVNYLDIFYAGDEMGLKFQFGKGWSFYTNFYVVLVTVKF